MHLQAEHGLSWSWAGNEDGYLSNFLRARTKWNKKMQKNICAESTGWSLKSLGWPTQSDLLQI